MSIPEISETELKMAALSSALTDVLASLSYEQSILRDLLVKHGYFSPGEYEASMKGHGPAAWQTRRDEIHQKIQKLAKATLARVKGGTVQ